MPWSALSATNSPTPPSEEWVKVALPNVAGILVYGFKITTGATVPRDWGTVGFWGLGQTLGELETIGRTYPIPLVGRGANQALVMIGSQAVDYIVTTPFQANLYYSIHRWMPQTTCYLYGYS